MRFLFYVKFVLVFELRRFYEEFSFGHEVRGNR